jgi:hypothetical protein
MDKDRSYIDPNVVKSYPHFYRREIVRLRKLEKSFRELYNASGLNRDLEAAIAFKQQADEMERILSELA